MSEQEINVSLLKDRQTLLDKLMSHLDGLSLYDARYIAGLLNAEIEKLSKVSISPNG